MNSKNILIIIFLLGFSSINPQVVATKWESVFESGDKIILIDTSSIKQFESQISVLTLTTFKKPQLLASLDKEVASIKTQLLFNAASKKYSVIGTLYYDQNLKILGETSLPGFTTEGERFSLLIEGDEAMTSVFNRCLKFLKSNLTVIEQKEFSKEGEKNKNVPIVEEQKPKNLATLPSQKPNTTDADKNKTVQQIEEPKNKINLPDKIIDNKDSSKSADRVSIYLSKKDSVQKAELAKSAKIKTNNDQPVVTEISKPKVGDKQSKSSDQNYFYNSNNESNPRNMIFSDGTKYCFQVSSWKIKSVADREVRKLKQKGLSAFITQGLVKGSNWYRVRVGYFDSIEDAESNLKKLKR
jgi:cell division protein FtsN